MIWPASIVTFLIEIQTKDVVGWKNYQFLSGEYGVHDGDISSGKVWRDGEDEDAWIGELGDQIESVDN